MWCCSVSPFSIPNLRFISPFTNQSVGLSIKAKHFVNVRLGEHTHIHTHISPLATTTRRTRTPNTKKTQSHRDEALFISVCGIRYTTHYLLACGIGQPMMRTSMRSQSLGVFVWCVDNHLHWHRWRLSVCFSFFVFVFVFVWYRTIDLYVVMEDGRSSLAVVRDEFQ